MTDLTAIVEIFKQFGLYGGLIIYLFYRFDRSMSIGVKQDKILENQDSIKDSIHDLTGRLEAVERGLERCKLKT